LDPGTKSVGNLVQTSNLTLGGISLFETPSAVSAIRKNHRTPILYASLECDEFDLKKFNLFGSVCKTVGIKQKQATPLAFTR
jgi:hypothetical protein